MLKELRSSPRKLATVFRVGRDAWKTRAQAQQQRAKALAGKVRDLTVSRDLWKAKAKSFEDRLRQLEAVAPPIVTHEAAPPVIGCGSAAPPFCPLRNAKVSASA